MLSSYLGSLHAPDITYHLLRVRVRDGPQHLCSASHWVTSCAENLHWTWKVQGLCWRCSAGLFQVSRLRFKGNVTTPNESLPWLSSTKNLKNHWQGIDFASHCWSTQSVGVPWISLQRHFSPECQVCTSYVTEFSPGSFPTPTKQHLSIFSNAIGLPILPAHSLELVVSATPCLIWQPKCKTFPRGGQEQELEQLVNSAPPQLAKLCLHKFPLQASNKQQSRNAKTPRQES